MISGNLIFLHSLDLIPRLLRSDIPIIWQIEDNTTTSKDELTYRSYYPLFSLIWGATLLFLIHYESIHNDGLITNKTL